jgi:hypothetical protein
MKYIKMLGLAAVATAAFMAFAGTASATITGPTPGALPTTIHATGSTAAGDGSYLLEAGFAEITCTESTVHGDVNTNDTLVASGPITGISFTGCGSATVDPLKNADGTYGSLEIQVPKGKAGEGTVVGYNTFVTTAVLGTSCVYSTSATGTLLGTLKNGTPAKLTISASLPKASGGLLCANPAKWTGTYTVTTPSSLILDD